MDDAGHCGLGFVVLDPRLAAGRGEEFTNSYQEDALQQHAEDGGSWADFGDDADQGPHVSEITINTAIPETNVGFKLLQRMGWSRGKGLGRNEDGITEPVRAGVDAGVRLGLGKQAQDDHYTNPELIERRKLESEIQANEDDERRRKREAQAEREQRIREEVTEIKRTFYCEVCRKQYEKAMELEAHLSSYDHHHTKRMAEMRAMHSERTRSDRVRREARAAEKELAKLAAQ